MTGINEKSILLVPLGACDREDLQVTAECIEEQFDLRVRIGEDLGPPAYALDPVRNQYNSNLILKNLNDVPLPEVLRILGVTSFDLFSPIFSYVFGEAQFGGKCAVISTFRLRGDPDAGPQLGCPPLLNRMEKEAIHELGHTFGLRHCKDPDCVMHYSSGVQCADRKFAFFCPVCLEIMMWQKAKELPYAGADRKTP